MNLDLSKLKQEIESKKGTIIKESGGSGKKDNFLNDLMLSLERGEKSESTEHIKLVENEVARKTGDDIIHKNNNQPTTGTQFPQNTNNSINNDRDDLFEQKLNNLDLNKYKEHKKKELSETQQSSNSNVDLDIILEVINDKFGNMVGSALKENLAELYTASKIKEALVENKDFIKNIVVEVIRELQQKNKKRKES